MIKTTLIINNKLLSRHKLKIISRTVFIDPEDGLYFRRYLWQTGSFGDNQSWYTMKGQLNCHPFVYGWEGTVDDMHDWVRWYTSFEEKKPKNPVLRLFYTMFVEPISVESYFFWESKFAIERTLLIEEALEKGDIDHARAVADKIDEDAEGLFSCYLFDMEEPMVGNYVIEYVFSCLLWDFIFFWGMTTYITLIDIRWGFYTCVSYINQFTLFLAENISFIKAFFLS